MPEDWKIGSERKRALFDKLEEVKGSTVLVRKNPLKNLKHLRKLEGVMVHGRWLSGSDLNRRLSELENRLK